MAVWVVGLSIWITFGLALVLLIRSHYALGVLDKVSRRSKEYASLGILGVAAISGLVAVGLSYGGSFVFDWTGVSRVEQMASTIEQRVPSGDVNIAIRYTGLNPYRLSEDEHGLAYLLMTKGWTPGMEAEENHLLGMPITPKSIFVVFNEHGEALNSVNYYPHYIWYWSFLTHYESNAKPIG